MIKSRYCYLVLKISFVQNIFFSHYVQSIFFYIFASVNLMMFLSLLFICARLWMFVCQQFTKYGLVFKWLTVTANKFGLGVYTCTYFNKQNSEYARILNVPDAIRRSLYKLLSSCRYQDVFKTLMSSIYDETFYKNNYTWVQPPRNFSEQERFRRTRALWYTSCQKHKKKRPR